MPADPDGLRSSVKGLISRSVDEVQVGSSLASKTAEKLDALLNLVRHSANSMKHISGANVDQATAIAEVTAAIKLMDERT